MGKKLLAVTVAAMAMVFVLFGCGGSSVATSQSATSSAAAAGQGGSQVIVALSTEAEPEAGFNPIVNWGSGLCRDGRQEPAIVLELVRVPVQGQAGRGEMAESGKGAPPFVHGRRHFPQLTEAWSRLRWLTVGNVFRVAVSILSGTVCAKPLAAAQRVQRTAVVAEVAMLRRATWRILAIP